MTPPVVLWRDRHLKRYDLAAKALAEARRISPDDPQVEELTALLESLRPADSPE
jgi:hypothetical protein